MGERGSSRLILEEPEQLPGRAEPASCKAGPDRSRDAKSPKFVGIDVSQAELDVAVRPSAERWAGPTDDAGVAALVARLQALQPA